MKPITATLHTSNANEGSVSPGTAIKLWAGEKITGSTPTATAMSGYSFVNWTEKVANGTAFDITSPVTCKQVTFDESDAAGKPLAKIYANFAADDYKITYKGLEGANNDVNPTSYTTKENVTLQVPEKKEGFYFTNWVDNNGDSISEIPAGSVGDIEITAEWKSLTKVTVKPKEIVEHIGGESQNKSSFATPLYEFTNFTTGDTQSNLTYKVDRVLFTGKDEAAGYYYDLPFADEVKNPEGNVVRNEGATVGEYKVNIKDKGKVIGVGPSGTYYEFEYQEGSIYILPTENHQLVPVSKSTPSVKVKKPTCIMPDGTALVDSLEQNITDISGIKLLMEDLHKKTNPTAYNTLMQSAREEFGKIMKRVDGEKGVRISLVNEKNGNIVAMPKGEMEIYIPYPVGSTTQDNFTILHYEDDKTTLKDIYDYDLDNPEVYTSDKATGSVKQIEKTEVGLKISTDSFSPFIIAYESTPIKVQGSGNGADTGDDSSVVLMLMFLIISGLAIGIGIDRREKRARNN